MKTGIGICTYNRPEYFKTCIKFVLQNVKVDYLVVYNDGSTKGQDEYQKIYDTLPTEVKIINPTSNGGVAKAKNVLIKYLYDKKCDYFFTLEDDILLLSQKAVDKYIEASQKTGFLHFNFALHGPLNQKDGPVYEDNTVAYYSHIVGAWSMYTPEVIDKVGYLDEKMVNAYEHAEYTKRIGDAGLTGPWGLFVDIKDSNKYLTEIKDSIENSSIRPNPKWKENMLKTLYYWEQKDGIGIPVVT